MLKRKKQTKQTVEQETTPNNSNESFKDSLEAEYDSFASPPTLGSPDHGLSVYMKLHQILQYMNILVEEIKALRKDVNNEPQEQPKPPVVNNEIN